MPRFGVVDIFAGPGGLAEGFSKVMSPDGTPAYRIELSVEKDAVAYSTLLLRSFLRQFKKYPNEYYAFLNGPGDLPDWEALYPTEWARASREALQLELGEEDPDLRLNPAIDRIKREYGDNTILIGGPPCQAYSIVGRARNQGKEGYIPSKDERHYLYGEYIRILDRLRPAAFVMENVKGLLSSSVDGENMIVDHVISDLRGDRPGATSYKLIAITPRPRRRQKELQARDFVVRAEELGIPQARHRLIILGFRDDLAARASADLKGLVDASDPVTVRQVLTGMPRLRSGITKEVDDSDESWRSAILEAAAEICTIKTSLPPADQKRFAAAAAGLRKQLSSINQVPPRDGGEPAISDDCPEDLRSWLIDRRLKRLSNSDTRGHMKRDLARYMFAALFAEVCGRTPKAREYPEQLAPKHKNWKTGKFADRFRVQTWDRPARTVTCHISKDGHYFIHPDPSQCRSLTVREAARLQTFPDNYFFMGERTDQYVQVGNAVPPYLARQIAQLLFGILSSAEETSAESPVELDEVA